MDELKDRIRHALTKAGLSQTAAAHRIGVTPQSVYKWLKTGKIDKSNLQALADITGFGLDWFLKTSERSWTPKNGSSGLVLIPGAKPLAQTVDLYPLISYSQASDLLDSNERLAPVDAEDWLPWPYGCGEDTFALRVRGTSMENEFFEGEIVLVDPSRTPQPGDFVVVKPPLNREVVLKKLMREGDTWYLASQNREWPDPVRRLDESWAICGIIIGKFKKY
ncbi:LexA family protein [Marinobacter sp.]|uniref:LexA family protein n=1 Tax=Marinobacter sp. TaxID=50741 RepID=UPI003A939C21